MAEDIYLKSQDIVSQPWERAIVDIIIPFHGQYDRVGRLVDSIFRTTFSNPFRIILVDDASPNAEFMTKLEKEMVEKLKINNIRFLRNSKQKGFGGSCFEGFKVSEEDHKTKPEGYRYPYVCFMQSDCIVEDVSWLKSLYMTYENNRQNGVKFVSSRLSDSGGIGDNRVKGNKGENGKDIILEAESMDEILEKDLYVPLTAVFCHKDLFQKVGFFKEYPYGMYEDLEFACRLHSRGFKQAISGESFVRHEAGSTFKSLEMNTHCKREINKNFDRCVQDIKSLKGKTK